VLITNESGCFALLREDRVTRRYCATIPREEPVSKVGAGDTLLGAFIAARAQQRPLEDQLRAAVAAGAASTAEVGAGRFDPRHAARLQPKVEVTELTTVAEPAV
jgi:fructose-1-phosphate kinase PfkB-like protein